MLQTFGKSVVNFLNSLHIPEEIEGVKVINPYKDEEVQRVVDVFYNRYFNDNQDRTFIIGINPGRLGGGLTGISFTDPIALKDYCDIENNCGDKRELSSRFIYRMIEAFGGVKDFYYKFYLTALFPLALTKDNKNYNYYDNSSLQTKLEKEMIQSLVTQTAFGANRKNAICLGKKNYKIIEKLNSHYHFFDHLHVVEHPRYIMQYKLKQIEHYIDQYLQVMAECRK